MAKEKEKVVTVGKHRYWCAVLYPENMIDNWESCIGEKLQLPYAYCIHNDDLEEEFEGQERQKRKTHVHLIVVFPNTTTYNHAKNNVIAVLNAPGKNACNKIEPVRGIRHVYEYLIHNTDAAKKAGKKQYSTSDRVTGNNFDIGAYEQVSSADKLRMSKEICDYIVRNSIYNFADLYMAITSNFDETYFEILQTHSGFYERLIKGNHYRGMQEGENGLEE